MSTIQPDRGAPLTAAPLAGSEEGKHVPRLALQKVTKSFGPITVLYDVDLEVYPGEIHGLVGQNGAGKSTITRILAGGYPDYGGRIEIDGLEVDLATPRTARHQGISVVYQELSLVPQMSVAENIMLGEEPGRFFLNPSQLLQSAGQLLEEVGMSGDFRLDATVGSLSVGVQQRVEIAKALVRNVKVLVLDEPTARLTGAERAQLIELMRRIAGLGSGIVFISHFLDEVLDVTGEVTVLRDGRVTAKGPTSGFTIDSLSVALVGRQLAEEVATIDAETSEGKVLLRASGLSGGRQVRDVSLVLRSGEILGIAGLVGSGRSTLARLLVGVEQSTAGTLEVHGQEVRLRNPRQALRLGIALVSEDRRTQGIIGPGSLADNLVLMSLAKSRLRFGLVKLRELRQRARDAVSQFNVQPADIRRRITTFSGGNQQKAIIARVVIARPDILVIDQPSAGTDVGTTAEIHQTLRNLAGEGKAILIISDDVNELVKLCNRLVVMRRGRVIAEPSPEVGSEELVKMMTVGIGEAESSTA